MNDRDKKRAATSKRRQPPTGLVGTYTGKTCDICGLAMPNEASASEHYRCGRELVEQMRKDESK